MGMILEVGGGPSIPKPKIKSSPEKNPSLGEAESRGTSPEEVSPGANPNSAPAPPDAGTQGFWPATQKEVYLSDLRDFLNSHKHYPRTSQRLREGGVIGVRFNISRDGRFSGVRIRQPSRFEKLNEEVVSLFDRLGSFKGFPPEVTAPTLEVNFEIEFRIQE